MKASKGESLFVSINEKLYRLRAFVQWASLVASLVAACPNSDEKREIGFGLSSRMDQSGFSSNSQLTSSCQFASITPDKLSTGVIEGEGTSPFSKSNATRPCLTSTSTTTLPARPFDRSLIEKTTSQETSNTNPK